MGASEFLIPPSPAPPRSLRSLGRELHFPPGADVFDAEGGGEILLVGEAEPVGHCLAVEVHVEGLVPVGVFVLIDHFVVDEPLDLVLVPVECVDVVFVGEVVGGNPLIAARPVFVFGRRAEDVEVHVVDVFSIFRRRRRFRRRRFRSILRRCCGRTRRRWMRRTSWAGT